MSNEKTTPTRGDIRYDNLGPIKCMTCADGYAMVRRPRCAPWVMSVKDWNKLSPNDVTGRSSAPRAMHYGVLA